MINRRNFVIGTGATVAFADLPARVAGAGSPDVAVESLLADAGISDEALTSEVFRLIRTRLQPDFKAPETTPAPVVDQVEKPSGLDGSTSARMRVTLSFPPAAEKISRLVAIN